MANTVRLTQTGSDSVAIVSAGAFGARVSEILAASLATCRQFGSSEITAAFTAADPGDVAAVVVALWRPDADLCERADELSFQSGRRWLPVIMEHPVIRIGPLVCPPNDPCFRCYARRRAQHDGQQWAVAMLRTARDAEDVGGPEGYLPHHARIAAAVGLDMLRNRSVQAEAVSAGEVTTIGLLHGGLGTSRVLACHGCTRCGPGGPPGRQDWIAERALSAPAVLSGSGAEGMVSVQ
jgi:bacteriocin biosynthesis cyclodehydratase domain-containing protein